jgi:tetratricopeptide (TPR) repeat protein
MTTTPGDSRSRWARLEELFDSVLEQPEADRSRWIDQACADDKELRIQLSRLIAAHQRRDGLLDRPLFITMATNPRDVISGALAGRYRIDRELGRGGMAVVFLAYEHKHGRPVVLKVLLPGLAASGDIAERFNREVRIIANLAHPHVIGLIDSGEAAGLLYYVMPYVEGETLRTQLKRGRIPPSEAVVLLRDVATALAYAHGHGVVHRDLKPENVLCTGGHAFLMDFGVAKLLEYHPREQSGATDEHAIIGTPGYMAPEQNVPGHVVDYRADIYAFGLVAREMLTGQGPLIGGPRLRELQELTTRAEIPAGLDSLIEDCLHFDPGDRPASAQELVNRLTRVRPSGAVQAPTPPVKSRRARWFVAAGLLAAAGVAAWLARPAGTVPSLPLPIAVAAFQNQTGDSTLDIWGRMAGDWVTQGLQETGLVTVVPWPVSLLATEHFEREGNEGSLVEHLRKETGAGTIVTGSYYLVGDSLRFRVEATDAVQGKLLGAPQPLVVPRDSALAAIREVRERLMGTVGLFTNEFLGGPGADALSRRPPRFDAYVAFDQGIQSSRSQNYSAAADHFARAYQLDTSFSASLLYRANSHWNEGKYELMDSVLGAVRPRLSEVSEYHRNWFAVLEASLAGDGERAFAAAQASDNTAPGSMAAYNMALIGLRVGRVGEALAALERLDPDKSEMRGWSPYWTQLAHAYHLSRNYQRELETTRELRTRYPDRRVGLVLEARALAALNLLPALDSALEVSSTLPPTTFWSQGAAMVVAGEELLAHGRKDDGRRYLARGVNWLRAELAVHPGDRNHRYWLASAMYDLARWDDAARMFAELFQELPDRSDYSWLTGLARARMGADTAEVARWFPQPVGRERGDFTAYRARLALIRGEREAALSMFADALRYGVDGLPWMHGSAVRDFEMLGELRERLPAGILP